MTEDPRHEHPAADDPVAPEDRAELLKSWLSDMPVIDATTAYLTQEQPRQNPSGAGVGGLFGGRTCCLAADHSGAPNPTWRRFPDGNRLKATIQWLAPH